MIIQVFNFTVSKTPKKMSKNNWTLVGKHGKLIPLDTSRNSKKSQKHQNSKKNKKLQKKEQTSICHFDYIVTPILLMIFNYTIRNWPNKYVGQSDFTHSLYKVCKRWFVILTDINIVINFCPIKTYQGRFTSDSYLQSLYLMEFTLKAPTKETISKLCWLYERRQTGYNYGFSSNEENDKEIIEDRYTDLYLSSYSPQIWKNMPRLTAEHLVGIDLHKFLEHAVSLGETQFKYCLKLIQEDPKLYKKFYQKQLCNTIYTKFHISKKDSYSYGSAHTGYKFEPRHSIKFIFWCLEQDWMPKSPYGYAVLARQPEFSLEHMIRLFDDFTNGANCNWDEHRYRLTDIPYDERTDHVIKSIYHELHFAIWYGERTNFGTETQKEEFEKLLEKFQYIYRLADPEIVKECFLTILNGVKAIYGNIMVDESGYPISEDVGNKPVKPEVYRQMRKDVMDYLCRMEKFFINNKKYHPLHKLEIWDWYMPQLCKQNEFYLLNEETVREEAERKWNEDAPRREVEFQRKKQAIIDKRRNDYYYRRYDFYDSDDDDFYSMGYGFTREEWLRGDDIDEHVIYYEGD